MTEELKQLNSVDTTKDDVAIAQVDTPENDAKGPRMAGHCFSDSRRVA